MSAQFYSSFMIALTITRDSRTILTTIHDSYHVPKFIIGFMIAESARDIRTILTNIHDSYYVPNFIQVSW